MDFTRDIINDNAMRKSLGRRVSFASHAQVRVFEKVPNRNDASPSSATNSSGHSTQPGSVVNDENDYPGASSVVRRRSSLRRSAAFSENGEASMDMDSESGSSPLPAGFLTQGSLIQDEEPDDVSGVWNEEADMDLTTNLAAIKPRKSSLGLSALSPRGEDVTQDSAGDLSGEQAEPTEFTVPLSKSLRKPGPPTPEWLALRAITHAGGDSPYEPPPSDADEDEDESVARGGGANLGEEDMDLTEAETRLRRMRESLGLTNIAQEDSFTSSEGSSFGGGDNQTVNLTNVWRDSLGTDSSSVMDVMNVQGTSGVSSMEEAVNREFSPPSLRDPPAPLEQHDSRALSVPPEPTSITPNAASLPQDSATLPAPPVFTRPDPVFSAPRRESLSPSKLKPPPSPRKTGTAAFALPVGRPQPKKPVGPPAADDEGSLFGGDKGKSPAKRQALPPPSKPARAPALTESAATPLAARRSSTGGSLRRPPGYFAQRKSLGPSGALNIPQPASPQKKAAQGQAGEADIDQNMMDFGREHVGPPSHPQLPVEGPSKGTSLSGTSDPPPLIPLQPFMEANPVPSAESEAPATERAVTFANVEAAEEWRHSVQSPNFAEEDEGVRIHLMVLYRLTDVDTPLR